MHTFSRGNKRFLFPALYHMRIPLRTYKLLLFGLCALLFFWDVRNKDKCDSEATYTCYLHFFFHTSLLGRKMLLRNHQEVKCQVRLKDTQSKGFCVSWIMYGEHEWSIKSFFHLMMRIISQTQVLPLSHRGNLSNNCHPFLRLHCKLQKMTKTRKIPLMAGCLLWVTIR